MYTKLAGLRGVTEVNRKTEYEKKKTEYYCKYTYNHLNLLTI